MVKRVKWLTKWGRRMEWGGTILGKGEYGCDRTLLGAEGSTGKKDDGKYELGSTGFVFFHTTRKAQMEWIYRTFSDGWPLVS